MEYFIYTLLLLIIAGLVLFIMRLIAKVEFYEDWIVAFKHRVDYSYDKTKAIDIRGSFEADDEIGFIFKDIKNLVDDLDKFVQ